MKYRRTKIIATLGPSCSNQKSVQDLVDLGVNCFRINLSHGTENEKKSYFNLVRSVSVAEKERPSILADLGGPKIRISGLIQEMYLEAGQKVIVSNEQNGINVIPVSDGIQFKNVSSGAKILIDDGRVFLKVMNQVSSKTLECCTVVSGVIKKIEKGLISQELI